MRENPIMQTYNYQASSPYMVKSPSSLPKDFFTPKDTIQDSIGSSQTGNETDYKLK